MLRAYSASAQNSDQPSSSPAKDRLAIGLARSTSLTQLDLHALEHLEASGPLKPRELTPCGPYIWSGDRSDRSLGARRLGDSRAQPDDRRSVLVQLSEPAVGVTDAWIGDYHREVGRVLDELSGAERAAVGHFLARVTDAARQQGDHLWVRSSKPA